MKKYGVLLGATILALLLISCSHHQDENTLFFQGKRVQTGLIWQPVAVSEQEVLKGYTRVPVYRDDFSVERKNRWKNLGGDWRITEGTLVSNRALNHNFVLSVPLPQDAVITLTMRSESDAVDVKFNAWGDGKQHEHGDGYSFILGGWHNRISVISRLNEHEKGRYERREPLKKGVEYRSTVIRIGKKIYWFVNGSLFLVYFDKKPLKTTDGYAYFSFGNWKSRVIFDNVKIEALRKK